MTKKNKFILLKFIKFVEKELAIETEFSIKIANKRTEEFKTYAYYDQNKKLAAVYAKDRALSDVCRSFAHELVHHKQNERKDINGKVQDVGGKIEDEANARAGSLIKQFGYDHPDLNIYEL